MPKILNLPPGTQDVLAWLETQRLSFGVFPEYHIILTLEELGFRPLEPCPLSLVSGLYLLVFLQV